VDAREPRVEVTDPADPRVGDYVDLTSPRARQRFEAGRGIVIAEGTILVRWLLQTGRSIRSVLLAPGRVDGLSDALAARADVRLLVAGPRVLERIAGFPVHRGVLAAVDRPPAPRVGELLATTGPLLALEDLTDHENLGAIFRNAAAFGVTGVLLSPRSADPYYRRAVRVSMGHVLSVPFTTLAPWPDALADVRDAGFSLIALTPAGDTTLGEPLPQRVAFMLGAEGAGLSASADALAHRRVRIPMAGDVDSLNVATAAAVALYELRRFTAGSGG
jgi:tRNA G18 (ribose-2'-O)-methylase SpoU